MNMEVVEEVDLHNALLQVTEIFPQVKWVIMAPAMSACVKNMNHEAKNKKVIAFAKDCMFQLFYIMISLKNIEGNPKTYTGLQKLWKADVFEQFNQCFHIGLSDAVRVMVRIGHVSTFKELNQWHNWEYTKTWHQSWIKSFMIFLDCEQPGFLAEDQNENVDPIPNSLWTICLAAFFEERGFVMMSHLLDSEVFQDLTADDVIVADHVLYCQIAVVLKRLVTREHVVVGQANMPTLEEVRLAMAAVESITANSLHWLKARLDAYPDHELTSKGKDTELITSLTELFGSDESKKLSEYLLSKPTLKSQKPGLLLLQEMGKEDTQKVVHFYLERSRTLLGGDGSQLVLELNNVSADSEQVVSTFKSMLKNITKNTPNSEEELNLLVFWGDLGFRCICTADKNARKVGFGLLGSLKTTVSLKERLAPVAKEALLWLTRVCCRSEEVVNAGFDIASSLEEHGLNEWNQLGQFFVCIHFMLLATDCVSEAATVPEMWIYTAIGCLRCKKRHEIREFGLMLIQNGLSLGSSAGQSLLSEFEGTFKSTRTQLGANIRSLAITHVCVKSVLDSLFLEEYVNSALIQHASVWFVDVYYREYCYEGDLDLMPYLVAPLVHPEWGVVDTVTDLLISLTLKNISINSLNSLCNLFKQAVTCKATSDVVGPVICVWFTKTSHKKWVVMVQERLMNLLWTVLMNTKGLVKVESVDVCATVLGIFKTQFNNIKSHASSDWSGFESDVTDRELIAKQCIVTYAVDCFIEIERCGDFYKQSGLFCDGHLSNRDKSTDDQNLEVRHRASQAATLLDAIFGLVDHLRPDILREINQGRPSEMVENLLAETLQSATYQDVEPAFVLVRLQLIAKISSYMIDSSPLTLKIVKLVWDTFFGIESTTRNLDRHRQICFTWFHAILRPYENSTVMVHFQSRDSNQCKTTIDEGVESRRFILEQLGEMFKASNGLCSMNLEAIGIDGMDCVLSLFLWVNKDHGVLEEAMEETLETGDHNHIPVESEFRSSNLISLRVCKTDILYFDLLTKLALDSSEISAVVLPACRSLHRVCIACHKASVVRGDTSAILDIKRYNLLDIIFSRIIALQNIVLTRSEPTYSCIEMTKVKHWLTVLNFYLEETSIYNSRVRHDGCIQGELLSLSVKCGVIPYSLEVYDNMTISEALSASLKVLDANKVKYEGNLVMRHHLTLMNEQYRTLRSYGVVTGGCISLEPTVVEVSPSSKAKSLSPSDQLSDSDDFMRAIFQLLNCEEVCDHAWDILQMVPSAALEQRLIQDPEDVIWANIVGSADKNRGLWQKIYSCQLIEKVLFPPKKVRSLIPWLVGFVHYGGFNALLTMVQSEDLLMTTSPYLKRAILSPLKIVDLCICCCILKPSSLLNSIPLPATDSATMKGFDNTVLIQSEIEGLNEAFAEASVDAKAIISFMFEVITIINNASGFSESELRTVSKFISNVTQVMKVLNDESWIEISSKFPLASLLYLLLESPLQLLRQEIEFMFRELLSLKKTYYLFGDVNGMQPEIPLPAVEVLGNAFFGDCFSGISSKSETTLEYFSVCQILLDDEHKRWVKPGTVRLLVESKLQSFTTSITATGVSDPILSRGLALLSRLHMLDPPSPQEAQGLVNVLVGLFLVKMQSDQNPSKGVAPDAEGSPIKRTKTEGS